MNIWEFLATGTGASIVGFLIKTLQNWLLKRKHEKRRDSFIMGMRSVAKVYASMSEIKRLTSADRVLLMEVTNGGNAPKPGSIMYARAIEAKAADSDKEQWILSRYESVRIDDAYINMVLQSAHTGQCYAFYVKTHADCLLKNIYITEGVKYSELYHLYTDLERQKMFIMTIATYVDGVSFGSASDKAIINLSVQEIREEFESYSKLIV